jgi:DHA2 family multidrug resistance protein
MAIRLQTGTNPSSALVPRDGAAGNVHGTSGAALPLHATITPGLRALIVIAVMAATFMEFLDTSIVNVAMPHMMGNLGATLDEIGWVSTGYIITNVIVLPLTGWLSDYFGRKRYLTYSIILFTAASLGCGISRSLAELVFWRVVQGAGGAAFFSLSQATLM